MSAYREPAPMGNFDFGEPTRRSMDEHAEKLRDHYTNEVGAVLRYEPSPLSTALDEYLPSLRRAHPDCRIKVGNMGDGILVFVEAYGVKAKRTALVDYCGQQDDRIRATMCNVSDAVDDAVREINCTLGVL